MQSNLNSSDEKRSPTDFSRFNETREEFHVMSFSRTRQEIYVAPCEFTMGEALHASIHYVQPQL